MTSKIIFFDSENRIFMSEALDSYVMSCHITQMFLPVLPTEIFFIPCSLKPCWRLLTRDMTSVTSSLSDVLGRMWTFRENCLWVTHHVYKSQLLERFAVRNPISPVLTPTNRMFLLIPEPLPILSTVQTWIYNFIYLTLIFPSGIFI